MNGLDTMRLILKELFRVYAGVSELPVGYSTDIYDGLDRKVEGVSGRTIYEYVKAVQGGGEFDIYKSGKPAQLCFCILKKEGKLGEITKDSLDIQTISHFIATYSTHGNESNMHLDVSSNAAKNFNVKTPVDQNKKQKQNKYLHVAQHRTSHLRGLLSLTLFIVAIFLIWYFAFNPDKNENINNRYCLIPEIVSCTIPARGYRVLPDEFIPWVPVMRSDSQLIYFYKGDSISIVFDPKETIEIGDTSPYLFCKASGLDKFGVPAEVFKKMQEKENKRKFINISDARIGALVYYLAPNYWDPQIHERRLQLQNEVVGVADPDHNPCVLGASGFLWLCVNDQYLYDSEIIDLLARGDSLMRPSKLSIQAYKEKKHDWFYEDNNGSFHVEIHIFRKKAPE